MAQVPEAFVEVTVSSTRGLHSLVSRHPQKALHKNTMQEDYTIKASLGGFPIHSSELLTRLDRGEVAWVPDLQSSDESTDEGPVKPTLKRWPKGGAWWDRYRSPAKYPSSDSSSSDDDQRSEVEGEKPQRGHRLTILRRSVLDICRGNRFQSVKTKESLNNGSQSKRSQGSQNNLIEAGDVRENAVKERVAEEEQQFSCLTCGQFFKSKISLSNHQRIHFKENATYECSFCGKKFAIQKKLTAHQRSHAREKDDNHPSRATENLKTCPEEMPYKCLECKKCFTLKDHLLLHQRRHTAEKPHKCSECGKSYIRKEHLARHQKIHQGPKTNTSPEKKVTVEDSPETSEKRSSTALVREITSLSDVGTTNYQETQTSLYKCQFCGKYLRSKTLLVDHERIHRELRPYKCPQCQKSFHFKYRLNMHQKIHMKQADCQYRGRCPSTTVPLAKHEKLHTRKRPYNSYKCPKGFIQKPHLLRHQETNVKRKAFIKRTNSLTALEGILTEPNLCKGPIHMQSVTHNSGLATYQKSHTKDKCYKCQNCGKHMKKKAFLINHMKIHRKKKKYQCWKCSESFSQKNHLAVHQRRHVREKLSICLDSDRKRTKKKTLSTHKHENLLTKKLSCCYCSKRFDNNYSVTRHEKIHSGEKPFRCAICDKGFIESYNLKRHEKTHLKGSGFKHHRIPLLQRPFTCAVCGKGFVHTLNLKRHVKTHLKKNGYRQPTVAEVSHVFSNCMNDIYFQGKGHGGPPANIKRQAASKTAENDSLEDTSESETEPQAVLGKGSKTGTPRGSEQRKMQVKVDVESSRKRKRHCQQNYRGVSANQVMTPKKKLRKEDNVILHYKEDEHFIHQQNEPQKNSEKVHLRSCEMVGWQLRSQAMPRRKSKRGVRPAGQRVRSCFCQKEGVEMAPRKIPSNSRVCKKSQNSQVCRKLKACSQGPPNTTVSSELFKSSPKNGKSGRPCVSLPFQRTLPEESKMEATESATSEWLGCSEQERGLQKMLGKELEDSANSQSRRTKKCQAYNATDQAESQVSPLVSRSDSEQNGFSNAALQKVATASIGQQMEAQSMSAGEPFSYSREEGGGCTETVRELQSSASQREIIAGQQAKHVCTQCNKSFRSRENLFVHEKNHRETRPFACIHCKKSFYTVQSLKTHVRIHTGEKPFRCTECDFCANTSSALHHHRKTHSQWKPYSCQQCKESFWFVHSLILHLGVHNTKEPYMCSDCGRKFARKNGLILHRKAKHSSKAAE
ncbi:uncharacterized protein LOC140701258 [Pogona vitticeps]